MNGPKYVAMDPQGRVLIADAENHCIRRYDPKSGLIERIAGMPPKASDGIGKTLLETGLRRPHGVRVGPDGRLYVCDTYNHRVLARPIRTERTVVDMTFWILVAAIVVVHLHLEYRVWIRREEDIFAKYRTGSFPPLAAARGAYLAKAAFLVILVVMQASGVAFREALVFSFGAYALLLAVLLPAPPTTSRISSSPRSVSRAGGSSGNPDNPKNTSPRSRLATPG